MNSTKILLITSEFPPQPGGIGNHAYHLAKTLHRKNQEWVVVSDCRSSDCKEEAIFDSKQSFKIHRIKRYSWIIWTYCKRVLLALRLATSSDLIVLSGKFSLWLGGLLHLMLNRPMLAILHGSELKFGGARIQKYTRYCLEKMEAVIAVSHFTLTLVEGVPLKRPTIIPNGFQKPPTNYAARGNGSSSLKLITIGNVTQRKGQHNVVAALPALKNVFPKVEYHIVGIPTNAVELQKQALHLGVDDCIEIHGKVSEEKKWELLSEASIFMMLSETTDSGDVEGFGIAILEANALGLPAIGSLGCGIEDAIADGVSGYLVDPKKPEDVVKAIKSCMANYPLLSKQAHDWSQGFLWEKVGEKYQKVITALLNEND